MERFCTNVFCGLVSTYTMMKCLFIHVLLILIWYIYNMYMMKDYSLWPQGVVAFIQACFPTSAAVGIYFILTKGARRSSSRRQVKWMILLLMLDNLFFGIWWTLNNSFNLHLYNIIFIAN